MVENQSETFAIGGTDDVHRLGYGAMRITGEDIVGPPADEATATDVLRHATDLGIDFVDTADSYGPGVSERLIREALHPYDDPDVFVATKGGLLRNRDGEWKPLGDPDYLKNAHLASLDRLGVEKIDLYQHHRPDPDVDVEDSLHALAELQDEGVVEHVGVSNYSVEQLERASDIVDVATVQNRFNLSYREEREVLEWCEANDAGFIPWYPLAAGDLDDDDAVDEIAGAHDATREQIALAWLLHTSDVTLPIPGTSSKEHLEENVAASQIDLDDDEVERLDDAA
ncbi:aldo/keto reductase [Halorubellus sp. JP-L1]|uniref:aldo/keto reductase n=1 Tax=Halorubellus sp. JP-L1 TaxID=2715753 RepID=UPI00140926A3|nr:aldo/keto reductase [Halorubellus sp. JP-L1]NHN41693.1 aldo/keto reductase [Halorubellus sp. JP-L1]